MAIDESDIARVREQLARAKWTPPKMVEKMRVSVFDESGDYAIMLEEPDAWLMLNARPIITALLAERTERSPMNNGFTLDYCRERVMQLMDERNRSTVIALPFVATVLGVLLKMGQLSEQEISKIIGPNESTSM